MTAAAQNKIGFMKMPADFRYRFVFLRGRPQHRKFDAFWAKHPPMPSSHWAKIYSPFDALEGFDEGIQAKDIIYTARRELSDGQKEALDKKLALLCSLAGSRRAARRNRPAVSIEYFRPCSDEHHDAYGSGGRYAVISGTVLAIDAAVSRTIRLSTAGGESVIPLDNVTGITGELFSASPDAHFQESTH